MHILNILIGLRHDCKGYECLGIGFDMWLLLSVNWLRYLALSLQEPIRTVVTCRFDIASCLHLETVSVPSIKKLQVVTMVSIYI